MKYTVRISKDAALNRQVFRHFWPDDSWVGDNHTFWIVRNQFRHPVGFCSAVMTDGGHSCYLSSAHVDRWNRGRGLQRKMIATRCRWAKRQGADAAVTYTLKNNWPSVTSLLRSGFTVFDPQKAWAGRRVWYFLKSL